MKRVDYVGREIKDVRERIIINSYRRITILGIVLTLSLILLIGYISKVKFVQILLFYILGLIIWLLYISINYKRDEKKLLKIKNEINKLKNS